MEYWTLITQRPPAPNVPQVVANINQDRLPFLAHLDDQGNWRNSHTKLMIADVAYWLENLPPFPVGSVPIKNPAMELASMHMKMDQMHHALSAASDKINELQPYKDAWEQNAKGEEHVVETAEEAPPKHPTLET